MHPLKAKMLEWLDSPVESERNHAAARLRLPFVEDPEPEPPPPSEARPPDRPRPPSLLARAATFASAVVTHVAAGLPTLDAAGVAARLAACDGCDQRLPGGVCAGCGCNLSVKAAWSDQDCPKGKWPVTPASARSS